MTRLFFFRPTRETQQGPWKGAKVGISFFLDKQKQSTGTVSKPSARIEAAFFFAAAAAAYASVFSRRVICIFEHFLTAVIFVPLFYIFSPQCRPHRRSSAKTSPTQ